MLGKSDEFRKVFGGTEAQEKRSSEKRERERERFGEDQKRGRNGGELHRQMSGMTPGTRSE